jgi:hypothetical protein
MSSFFGVSWSFKTGRHLFQENLHKPTKSKRRRLWQKPVNQEPRQLQFSSPTAVTFYKERTCLLLFVDKIEFIGHESVVF